MARINIDNWCISLFYYAIILLGSISSIKATVITAQTLRDFRNAGWVIVGTNPSTYTAPGAWKAALRPLDATVNGGSVWRVTSSSDTTFRFGAFVSELCAKSIKVEVTYFMENTVISVYPWEDPAGSGSEYFYPKPPSNVEWVTETIDIRPGNVIEFKMKVIGQYIFFDQINIEHDGVKCDTTSTTTEESTTTDTTRTTDDSSGWTEETPIEESVEPGTTNTDEEASSTTQMTTEEPSTTTPDEGIPEEPETGGTGTTSISTQPTTTDEPTGSTEASTTETTEVTEYPPTDSTSEDPTSSSTDDTSGVTDSSTTVSDTTVSTESTTTENGSTESTDGSTTVSDITESSESSSTMTDITGSTESSTTEGDTTESTVGSTTDNDESSESSTTLFPITSSLPTTSETTLSTNPSSSTPTESITPPPPASTSTTRIPVTILPPPVVLPGEEKQGLTVQQILLYIVLPTAVGITAFLGTVFYFGFKGYKWWGSSSKGSKEQLIREGVERASSRKGRGAGGGSQNPTPTSPPQQTSIQPRQLGNNTASFYPSPHHQQVSPSFSQATPMQMNTSNQLPRRSPSVLQSQFSSRNAPRIPPPTSGPNVGKSVTLNIPNQEDIYYGTSEPSNRNGNFNRPPVRYTGEYTGGELPRIRRKVD